MQTHDDSVRESFNLSHQQLVLEKQPKQLWLLKGFLIVLYIPAIVLFVWSYMRWSNFQHPRPREHYIYPDMIPCKSEHGKKWIREQKAY